MTFPERPAARRIAALWAGLGASLLALAAGLALASPRFGYDVAVRDMPVLWFAGGMALAGALYLFLPRLISATARHASALARPLLWLVLGAGLLMRLVLFASEPVLEDDFQRYLWDGAVVAHGLNPYATAPEAAKTADPRTTTLGRLAQESGPVLGRINHPHLRTLYPPAAQGTFALAHLISPFSLTAWRGVVLALDLATVGLLLLLLKDLGRSPLWAALYWWNPIVVKELANSAHMDAVVLPLVLAGLLLAIRGRLLAATGGMLLAAGAKIWPLLLLPLLWRPLLAKPKRLAAAVALTIAAAGLFAAPIIAAGLDGSSGLVAYASQWKTNSALFPLLESLTGSIVGFAGFAALSPGALARTAIALALGALALWLARTSCPDARELVTRALVLVAGLFLLSPAQFPWYYLWLLPLLACRPVPGLLLATATLPLYYSAFYFLARDSYAVFTDWVLWAVWLPVWAMLARDLRIVDAVKARLRPLRAGQGVES